MKLEALFIELAEVFDAPSDIERKARSSLLQAASRAELKERGNPLPGEVLSELQRDDAHRVCTVIADIPFQWAPPTTTSDPKYVKASLPKVHVELLGPEGIVNSDEVRIGLYGMRPGFEYGIRTHLAEEVFVMIAGEADWKRGDGSYQPLLAGGRSYHPSMMPHANKTGERAFLSVYAWAGDIRTDSYVFAGNPAD